MPNDDLVSTRDAVASAAAEVGFVDPPEAGGYASTPEVSETPAVSEPETPAVAEPETPVATPEPGKTPAVVEPEKVNEEDFRATAEELAIIDKNPELKKVYRGLIRGYTTKTEALSKQRKEAEAALGAMEAIKKDPKAAAKVLAESAGLKIVDETPATSTATPPAAVPAEKQMLSKISKSLETKLGKEAADVLAEPLLETISAILAEELSPVKQMMANNDKERGEQTLKSGIRDFGTKIIADGGEWNEDIEKEMADLVKTGKVLPGASTNLPEFLEVLHNNVYARMSRTADATRQVTRLREAVSTDEPVTPSRTTLVPEAPGITAGMDGKVATSLAIQQARKQLGLRP